MGLLGLETEYAIRFSPEPGGTHPGNFAIFNAFLQVVRLRVHTAEGTRGVLKHGQVYLENGGALSYEAVDEAMHGGLIEAATPECDNALQAVLYQRAMDRLLSDAVPAVEAILARNGTPGRVGLLKNCRDAFGNVYGAQESYEVDLARGAWLAAWRAGLALLVPAFAIAALSTWLIMLAGLALLLIVLASWALAGLVCLALRVSPPRRWAGMSVDDFQGDDPGIAAFGAVDRGARTPTALPMRALSWVLRVTWWPLIGLQVALLRAVAFRRQRRALMAFLVSRPVLSGAGTILTDGSFALSEKGSAINSTMRLSPLQGEHAIFDTGNFCKAPQMMLMGRLKPLVRLFRQRQRMQLGLSDSNPAQVAEYLKVGTTALLVELAAGGKLDDAPRLARPVQALSTYVRDTSLEATAQASDGRKLRALDVQRWYLERARECVADQAAAPLQALEILRLWGEALDHLERDPAALVGRLDWVTKRELLDRVGPDEPDAVRKKVDLRYHELPNGYFRWLETEGLAPSIVSPEDIERALIDPPESGAAPARSQLIRLAAETQGELRVSWSEAHLRRQGGRAEVIDLDTRRRRPPEGPP